MKEVIARYHRKILTILLLLLAGILVVVLIKQPPWLPKTVFSPTGLNGFNGRTAPTGQDTSPGATSDLSNLQPPTQEPLAETPYLATFSIYTNGTHRTFAPAMYREQHPDAYIASNGDPSIVTVQKQGITWGEFFDSLPSPFALTENCLTTGTGQKFCSESGETGQNAATLRFYLHEQETPDLLSLPIQPRDRVLITYGNPSPAELENQFKSVLIAE